MTSEVFKEDWDRAESRMKAWWHGAIIDRPVVQVTAPKHPAKTPKFWNEWELVNSLEQPERALDKFETWCSDTFFGGEAFPYLWINLGPAILAAFLDLGIEPKIAPDTVWIERDEPIEWEPIIHGELNPENYWWEKTLELTRLAADRGRSRYFTSITDLNSMLNNLGALRTTQQLLTDVIFYPDEIQAAAKNMAEFWTDCYDNLYAVTNTSMFGSITWLGLWAPGKGSDVQCDFSAMISPDMFQQFVVPSLEQLTRHLEYSVYHWDGPGQIIHLEHLLELPDLDGIQWTPGAGEPGVGSEKWFPLYKRIQEGGKLLVLKWLDPRDLDAVMEVLSPEGVLIHAACDTVDEAEFVLNRVTNWT
ncbi:MAG: hypothetical protein K9N46_05325 [Candidatus Marinimicrobia bacterium]|nr:hypothetical protein [Candidatus Neomarinimicrobiota bacterium]MCF7880143.1 hypothetical protein [Candidatus Neomarinimicrobiota bacterium]